MVYPMPKLYTDRGEFFDTLECNIHGKSFTMRGVPVNRVLSGLELLASPLLIPVNAIVHIFYSLANFFSGGSLDVYCGLAAKDERVWSVLRSGVSLLLAPATIVIEGISAVSHFFDPETQKIDYLAVHMWSGGQSIGSVQKERETGEIISPGVRAERKKKFDPAKAKQGFVPGDDTQEPQLDLSLYQPPTIGHQEPELKTYFDEKLQTCYFVPLSLRLVEEYVGMIQLKCGYLGESCGAQVTLKNLTKQGLPVERCDMFTLTKNPDQVKAEAKKTGAKIGTSYSSIFGLMNSNYRRYIAKSVKEYQANQAKAYEQMMRELPAKIKEWHYDSFMVADEKMLLTLGYPKEEAKKLHLLALFYKKVPMDPQS